MTDLFHALADPTRRELLDRLFAKRGQTLGELVAGATISRQGISKHLAVLEAANLVTVRWEGRCKRHFLNSVPISKIVHRWVGKFEDARLEALTEFRDRCESDTEAGEERRHAKRR